MYQSNFWKFQTLIPVCTTSSWLSTNQPKPNNMMANDGQLKLTICDV